MPPDAANLDHMYGTGDLMALGHRITSENSAMGLVLDLNWERARLFSGAGFIVALYYFQDLWRSSSNAPGLKDTSAAMFLYALDLILVDGVKCSDQSAPGHRLDQLFGAPHADILKYLQDASPSMRQKYIDLSVKLEGATARLRQDDIVLCSGGMAQMDANIQALGDRPVPSAPGVPGKSFVVPNAPGYQPGFVDAAISGPKQLAARQALADNLAKLFSKP